MTKSDWLALPRGAMDALLPLACPATGMWITGGAEPLHPKIRPHLDQLAALNYCSRCARTSPTASLNAAGCGDCRSEAWNLRKIVRLGPYDLVLKKMLLDLKFRGNPITAQILAKRMADCLLKEDWIDDVDLLVPVPMSWLRRWQRPGNHAAVLAKLLSRLLGIPMSSHMRQSQTASQATIRSREAKIKNVRGAFQVVGNPFAGQTVCVIDNLITSGATICEMSRVLRRAGAKRVYAAVVARAGSPGDLRNPLWQPSSKISSG